MPPLRRTIIVLSLILLLFVAYRVFAVYTVRTGECNPKPVDPNLRMHYPTFEVPLTPLASGEYFDRLYWSFVRFESGKMTYRNGSDEFTATSAPAPGSPAN